MIATTRSGVGAELARLQLHGAQRQASGWPASSQPSALIALAPGSLAKGGKQETIRFRRHLDTWRRGLDAACDNRGGGGGAEAEARRRRRGGGGAEAEAWRRSCV